MHFTRLLLSVAILSFSAVPVRAVHTLPAGFDDPAVFLGLTLPTSVRFSPDGRIFVAEKSGRIKVFQGLTDTTPDLFADLSTNVHDFWDRGLLGLALDPNFPASPYVYVFYTYDYDINTPSTPPPRWGDQCPGSPTGPGATTDGCVVNGRITRLEISPANTQVGGEFVVLENFWCQQFPSHSVGGIQFGPEGALYAPAGDGASFNYEDYGQSGGTIGIPLFTPKNPCGDPPSGRGGTQTLPTGEGGALRSQDILSSGDPVTFDGAVLRINPATGAAWPDNPLIGGDAQDDRIIAHGLRNPFRSTVRPGTSELWIGDVGWNTFEEINRIADPLGSVENFGWPCYEGSGRQPGYDGKNLNMCENLYATGSGAVVAPYYAYDHASDVDPAGDACPTGSSSIAGLAFYISGAYPGTYNDALFFTDYSRKCIYVIRKGANGLPDLATRTAFVVDAFNPVDLQRGPGGDLFYADFDGGTIRRIKYTTGNSAPTAAAQANPTSGPVPLFVQFDGSGSTDPDPGTTLFYAWDLDGDGQYDDATIVNPTRTYATAGAVIVGLRVTDDDGAIDTDAIVITPGSANPVALVVSPSPALTWRVGDAIAYSGSATDSEDGVLPPSAKHWDILLHHCPGGPSDCHQHPIEHHDGVDGGVFTAPDHEWYTYLEFRLTVFDSTGRSGQDAVSVDPVTVTNSYVTSPAGLHCVLGGEEDVAPFDAPAIVGSTNSLSAISPQALGPSQYYWTSWSDGGAQSHAFVAGETAVSRTATFAPCGTLDTCDGLDNDCNGNVDDAPIPGGVASLALSRTQISWGGRAEATAYDVIRGGLVSLHGSGGDFTTSTQQCLANDLASTTLAYVADPAPDEGWWILSRAVSCVGVGSYDSGAPSQGGSRDAEIQASTSNCPSGDSIAPTVPQGLAASAVPGLVTLTWSASTDNVGVTLYGIHRALTAGVVPTPGNRIATTTATYYKDKGFPAGTYRYVITALDAAGNVSGPSNEQAVSVAADTTPPSVTITTPSEGSVMSGTVTVTANAFDDVAVEGVQFLLDGASLGAEDPAAPYAVLWDTSSTPTGSRTLSARARDAKANTNSAADVHVTILGLVAAYSFDAGAGTQAVDNSGNGNNGTLAGALWTASGKYGSALSFNGTSSYVDLGNPAALQLTGSMTIEAWVKASANPADDGQIVAKSDHIGWQFKTSPDAIPHTFGLGVSPDSGSITQRYSNTVRSLNTWYHAAGVYDTASGTLSMYVNGVLDNGLLRGTIPAVQFNQNVNVNIGRRTGGYYFDGVIDEVRIYNRALSQAEIQHDMNTPISGGP